LSQEDDDSSHRKDAAGGGAASPQRKRVRRRLGTKTYLNEFEPRDAGEEEEEQDEPQIRRKKVPPVGVQQLLHLASYMLKARRLQEDLEGVRFGSEAGGFAEKALPLLESNRLTLHEAGKIISMFGHHKRKPVDKEVAMMSLLEKQAMRCISKLDLSSKLEQLDTEALSTFASNTLRFCGDMNWQLAEETIACIEKISLMLLEKDCCGTSFFSASLHGYSMLGLRPEETLMKKLEKEAVSKVEKLNEMHIADILWSYANMGTRPGEELEAKLDSRALKIKNTFTPNKIATTLWACATLKLGKLGVNWELMKAFEAILLLQPTEIMPDDLTKVLRAFADLGWQTSGQLLALGRDPEALELKSLIEKLQEEPKAFEERAVPLLKRYVLPAGDVAKIVSSYGKLMRRPGPHVLQLLEGHVKRIIPETDSKSVSKIVSGCAKMGWVPSQEILECMDERACVLKDSFTACNLANTLGSFATMGFRPKVMHFSVGWIKSHLVSFHADQISYIMYAHAKLGVDIEHRLMGQLETQALKTMKSVVVFRHVVNFLWSYAMLGMSPCREMVQELERKAISFDKTHSFLPELVADLLWSFATLRVSPCRRLMEEMEAKAVSKGAQFLKQDVARMSWAFETMGWQTCDELLAIGRGEVLRAPPLRTRPIPTCITGRAHAPWHCLTFCAQGVHLHCEW
jgi:hypothetical protein